MRCIAATTKLILFAAATNALAPVASMAKSKTQKKRSTHKKKSPAKLDLARPIKKPERFADFVEMDDAAFEKRVEAFMRDTTTLSSQCPRSRGCLQLSGSLALSPPRHRRDVAPGFIPTHRSCPPQLMIKCLNNKFNRNTEQQFKKKHTGLGWGRAVNLVDTAIELQHSLGRL